MQEKILNCLEAHKIWIKTIGKKGEKLKLDAIDFREMNLMEYPLDQSFLTDCVFDGMNLKSKDWFASHLCSSHISIYQFGPC